MSYEVEYANTKNRALCFTGAQQTDMFISNCESNCLRYFIWYLIKVSLSLILCKGF